MSCVSLLFLYGTNLAFSDKAAMTSPKADKLLLMDWASFSRSAAAPVVVVVVVVGVAVVVIVVITSLVGSLTPGQVDDGQLADCGSLRRFIVTLHLIITITTTTKTTTTTMIAKIECDLDDSAFIWVAPVCLSRFPLIMITIIVTSHEDNNNNNGNC